jgi:hypothetical protein
VTQIVCIENGDGLISGAKDGKLVIWHLDHSKGHHDLIYVNEIDLTKVGASSYKKMRPEVTAIDYE